jgi:hypothetical protein
LEVGSWNAEGGIWKWEFGSGKLECGSGKFEFGRRNAEVGILIEVGSRNAAYDELSRVEVGKREIERSIKETLCSIFCIKLIEYQNFSSF